MSVLRPAWYRFRATFRRQWGGYLALALLIGALGGVALGSQLAARRTLSSYPQFLASTNPSDLIVQPSTNSPDGAGFLTQLARLPHVRKLESAIDFHAATITPAGHVGTILITQVQLTASTDGLFSDQDRVTMVQGRMPVPQRADEVVASPAAAALLHLRVGSHLEVGLDTNAQRDVLPFYRRTALIVVGIGVFNIQVISDDVDSGRTGFLLGSPALARKFARCCAGNAYDGLQLTGGSVHDALVEREYEHLLETSQYATRSGGLLQVYSTSVIEAAAQRAIRPEAVALAVFGLIAGLAALLIGTQAISRQLRSAVPDTEVLRALGAGPAVTAADSLTGVLCAVVAGSLLAAAVAAALSPFSLFGPVRAVEPSPGVDVDWTVLGLGTAILATGLTAVAVGIGYRQAPHRTVGRQDGRRGSRTVRAALAAGLPASGIAGVRWALETGRGRTAVPVRSVILGSVLAILVVTATLTFGASLRALISQPRLYGWNFSYALYSVDGYGPLPTRWTGPLLARDPDVLATTGVYFQTVQIDCQAAQAGCQTVPALLGPAHPSVAPVPLSGHGLDGTRQIVLGPTTLAQLHKRIGQTVTVAEGGIIRAVTLRIVGTATLPTVGTVLGVHATMSTGALLPVAVVPPKALRQQFGPLSGPNAIFVRLRPGVSHAAALRRLQQITRQLNRDGRSPQSAAVLGDVARYIDAVSLLPVQRPAEIVNYRSMGTMPEVLAGGLAAGTLAALALTLTASVRRRRRDFALLKTLGFTRRQLADAVAWQSSVIAAVGLLLGVPLGIAAGRWLWLLFARELSAVPEPAVPVVSIALVALATLVLANVVAALPGRRAARTPAATVLRAE